MIGLITKIARGVAAATAGTAMSVGAGALSTSAQALNALSMPAVGAAKLLAKSGGQALSTTSSGIAAATGQALVAAPKGTFDQLVMPHKGLVADLARDVSPSGWMAGS